jgi:CMP-N-acetylneuraminic acid synthetase
MRTGIVAIIPAKGTSEGLPGKNLKYLNGRSLLERAVDSAQADVIEEIYVSTDSVNVVAQLEQNSWGKQPKVLHRPGELTLPDVQVEEVVLYCVRQLQMQHDGVAMTCVVVLQPTSPFRLAAHVGNATKQFMGLGVFKRDKNVFKPLMSGYTSFKYHYHANLVEASPISHNPLLRKGRQAERDARLFVENGAIYIASGRYIIENKTFRSAYPVPYYMGEQESIEIDRELDWEIAETLSRRLEE